MKSLVKKFSEKRPKIFEDYLYDDDDLALQKRYLLEVEFEHTYVNPLKIDFSQG